MKHLAEIYAGECVAAFLSSCQMHVSEARELARGLSEIVPVVVKERFLELPPHVDSSAANRWDSAVNRCLFSTSSLTAWGFAKPVCFAGHLIVSDRGWIKGERCVSPVTHPEVMESSSEGQSHANT